MKAFLGKYKAKEVDARISAMEQEFQKQNTELLERIDALTKENESLRALVNENDNRERLIAKVMVDAAIRAKDIEADYQSRAEKSDEANEKLRSEWQNVLHSCEAELENVRGEAEKRLSEITKQLESICDWTKTRLEIIESTKMPELREAVKSSGLEAAIAAGANADLNTLCSELGYNEDDTKPEDEA